jgi:type IV pilus assembly protein PilY1
MSKDDRSKVLQSQIAPTLGAATYGSSSSNAPNWKEQLGWYMDLDAGGERINLPAQQVKDVVFLVANKPESNPCANGGMSKIFALDPVTGRAPAFVVFDVNNNGSFEPATEKGLNVKLNRSGILTQPIFQLPQQAAYTAPLVGTTPFAIFDRGQSTSARAGGVELSRSAGGTVSVPNPCALIMSASQSDTALTSQYVQTCAPVTPKGGPARISWRQLR